MATFSADPVFLLWSREGSDTRPGAWYEPNHFVPLYSVKADGFYKSDETGKDEPATGPCNGNCQNNNVTGFNIGAKQKGEGGDLKKKVKVSGEIRKEKKRDEGIKKASKRWCLEQFGFQSQLSSSKKAKKEDLPNTESTSKVENASGVENSTPAEVFSKSSE